MEGAGDALPGKKWGESPGGGAWRALRAQGLERTLTPRPHRKRPITEGEGMIGVISDTHGLLRPQALDALEGSSLILHAGDVGDPDILVALESLAPVIAIRGNTDRGEWSRSLPETRVVEVDGALLYLIHDLSLLDLAPEAAGIGGVIFGHTHLPELREKSGVLYFNPGSAGPRRFDYPVTVGRLEMGREGKLSGSVVTIL